jgi:ketosteroid isomerase-like protein
MSQEDMELVQALTTAFANEGDAVALLRDEERVDRLFTAGHPLFHEDFETVMRGWPQGEKSYHGLLENRRFWQDWLAPWVEYRQEVWKTIDLGDRVLVLFHDFGRRKDSTHEIRGETAGIWTVRDGQVARAEFFLTADEALKAAGLEDQV